MKCIIAIPVYKDTPDSLETISLNRLLDTVGDKLPICVVTHSSVRLETYRTLFRSRNVEFKATFFHRRFFDGVKGYSKLLLSRRFYERFSDYSHMLIYQLDAYLFRDELERWCSAGFDYVGAPFITLFRKGAARDSSGMDAWGIGNGGLSLRRVEAFLSAYSRKGRVFSLGDYFHNTVYRRNNAYTLLKKICYTPKYLFDWAFRNNVARYIETSKVNEDIFWCFAFNHAPLRAVLGDEAIERLFLRTSRYADGPLVKLATVAESLEFAFDEAPEIAFKLSNDRLPMGCHAFNKRTDFWSAHIPALAKD